VRTQNVIEMRGVHKAYRHFRLRDIGFNVPEGSVMGLIGPNGAGKSTMIRILMGLVRFDRGTVEIFGKPVPAAQSEIKQQIGYVSEDLRLYGGASIGWHMDFVRSLYPEQWDDGYARALLSRFRLVKEQKARGLSHGQRVKTALLLALAHRPRLLILDEPTTGLDPVARSELLQELAAVLRESERTVLFSSHNTDDVEQLSDRITFVHGGTILATDEKTAFLGRWRRLHLDVPAGVKLPESSSEHLFRRAGPHTTEAQWITRAYGPALIETLSAEGVKVGEVENLDLEEIFVAQVGIAEAQSEAS
jgi:ABC-2 type transport system ATP-binding protein